MLGETAEKKLVKTLNSSPESKLWDDLNISSDNSYAVHVTEQKYSRICGGRVPPKADVYIANGFIPDKILQENNYYVDESFIEKFSLEKINETGISVKMADSKRFTITKMRPSTFKYVFGSLELGAGKSLYSRSPKNIHAKNLKVIVGWETNLKNLIKYFNPKTSLNLNKLNKEISDAEKKRFYKKIKNIANDIIKEKINTDKFIQDFIFKGTGNFKEPYTAQWFYHGNRITKAGLIPFTVTTGSGRSRGDFTVVIKPK